MLPIIKHDQLGTILSITMPRWSNFHAHLRREALMRAIAALLMRHVLYLLVMPNTGPIRTMADAMAYYDELTEIAVREGFDKLKLVMTLYHTAKITPFVVETIAKSQVVRAIKHYPPHPGATTGSGHGVPLEESHEMLVAMQANQVPLLGHFESVVDEQGHELSHPEREGHYIENHLWRIREKYPDLKICFEHASTRKAVEFVKADTSGKTVCTITPHHPLFGPEFFRCSWGNHLKCMPIPKGGEDQEAVLEFMTSGDKRAIAGDDDAAHLSRKKHVAFDECASGCFLPHAAALYALSFMRKDALDERFVNFMCYNGPDWWGLPRPADDDTITLTAAAPGWDIPTPVLVPEENDLVIPLGWSTAEDRLHVGLTLNQ